MTEVRGSGLLSNNVYIKKILGISPSTIRAYWPGNESGGAVATNVEGTTARDAAIVGVQLQDADGPAPRMGKAGLWDGTSDYFNIYSASLNGVWTGLELTIAGWAKVASWDSSSRRLFRLAANGSNEVRIIKSNTVGRLSWDYIEGGSTRQKNKDGLSGVTDWIHVALTVSAANLRMRAYYNGVQEGADIAVTGAYTGALAATLCAIGAANTTPTNVFLGNLAHWAVWSSELTAAQVAALAVAV